ncbi:MAG: DUF1636 family protein [Nostoc sp.]|uniref:DUF1636 family protein n=1 Tax=Nostoc sp. TaxID=1180 RepID=UPI002FF4FE67
MKSWCSTSGNKYFTLYSPREWRSPTLDIYLWLVVSVVGIIGGILPQPEQALASEKEQDKVVTRIKTLSETEFPATSVKDLLSQSPTSGTQSTVVITGVKANPTDSGVEVILETTQSDKLQAANRSTGNSFIMDVTGGQLRLPNGDAFTFKSEKPLAGITEITATNIDANTVRVTVIGEKALPAVELFDDNVGLIFTVASTATTAQEPEQPTQEKPATQTPEEQPAAQQDDPIELVVTAEQDGYRVPDTSVGTKTDTPLRDIPQSIQVVPRQVLQDRQARSITDALENVSGVTSISSSGSSRDYFTIRGFEVYSNSLVNGLPDPQITSDGGFVNVERLEVLKGPASVLYGDILLDQLNTLCAEQFPDDEVEIQPVGCLWACSHGCVVSVASPDKPTYLFVHLTPGENAAALLDFMQLYIKSPKGNVVWKKIPEILQSAIFAQIPSVLINETPGNSD